jgi:hypothetical protein
MDANGPNQEEPRIPPIARISHELSSMAVFSGRLIARADRAAGSRSRQVESRIRIARWIAGGPPAGGMDAEKPARRLELKATG